MTKRILLLFCCLGTFAANGQKKTKRDYLVTLETSKGEMKLVLFDETPLHKTNFIKLVEGKFYDDLLFHRVMDEFMIQGGDPQSKNAEKGQHLGMGGSDLPKIPYEFVPTHVHTKGALAAARSNNPKKESSACQFYIVTGKKYSSTQMAQIAKKNEMSYSEAQLKAYQEQGGTPFLDNNYTVFGQVISGISVAEAIEKVKTDRADRPEEDLKMKMTVKKMKKKKIEKKYAIDFRQ